MFVFSPFSRALRRACTATGVVVALVAGTLAVASGQPASAASPGMVGLGTASSFAVLGGSAVANTGPSVINGDLGVSPGTSVTGFPPGNYTGTLHVDDGTARNAQADATTAYLDAAGRPFDQDLTGQNLGGKTLLPGVYEFASSAQLTGTLTLDAQGDPDAVFILQAGSTLTTASASRVVLTNGARACRVFWQLGTAATLGSNSTFVGTILAASAITMNSGANVYGALFTQSEAVTLDTNTVTPTCATAVPAITVSTSVAPASRPAPGGLFTYSVTVTNDSSGAVTLTSLIDDVYGNLDGVGSCTTGGTILAGESYVCAFARTFNGAAGEALTNTTTATVHDADNNPAVGADATTVLITAAPDPGPGVTVDKRASPSSRPEPGGSFTFAVSVTNTGINDTVLTVLDDDIYGDLDGQGTCATGGTILAGATYTCSFVGTFTGEAGDSQTDIVTAVLTDPAGNTFTAADDATVRITAVGVFEICKAASHANGRVTGTFTFTFDGRSVNVPVGSCTGPLTVPVGNLTVREVRRSGVRISACATRPSARLVKCDPANSLAVIRILAGGVANETILTITNRLVPGTPTGAIKVCKIAGSGVAVGTNFSFTVDGKAVTVAAGPASQGGYCKLLYGFVQGNDVVVTESAKAGTRVSAITVNPSTRKVSSNNANRTATVKVGSGTTVVSFTNTATNVP